VGISSAGQSVYEKEYNSGIGSNGLTSARHDVLEKYYAGQFPESFDPGLEQKVVYIGPHRLTDNIISQEGNSYQVGRLLLSPTRTYAPLMKALLTEHFGLVRGLIHCSGGGQTKCMKYLPEPLTIIKDNLFDPPPIFRIIQQASGSDNREMYQVFNMGHRLEVFTHEKDAETVIAISRGYGIDARVVGRVESSGKKELVLRLPGEDILYQF
jgi:phosphoribosylformylglycinamidine cyclo-ligase